MKDNEAQRTLFEAGDGGDDGNARRPPNKSTDPFPGVAASPPPPAAAPPGRRLEPEVTDATFGDPAFEASGRRASPRSGRSSSSPSPSVPALPLRRYGAHEGADGQVRPGLPVEWPWHRWGFGDERVAPREVVEAIGREFARPPAVVPGGRVVFASRRLGIVEASAEEVATVTATGRTIPATIERAGEVYRLVKLGTWAWANAGFDAIDAAKSAGRVTPEAWKGALFALCRLRLALLGAQAFTEAALDWAELHGGASASRAFAISGLPGSAPAG